MKLPKQILFCVLGLVFLSSFNADKRVDMIISGDIWLDNNSVHINAHGGEVLFDKGKYYWFGEHKTEGNEGNVANVGVHCYSSKDLYNWKDEGISLKVDAEGSGSVIEKGCIIERPKVIFNKKTGKYVMWFHLERKGAEYQNALAGVAVSNKITGPYIFMKSLRPNAGKYPVNVQECHKKKSSCEDVKFTGWNLPDNVDSLNILGRDLQKGQMSRDMNLFVDDDQKAYLIYTSEENSTLHIAELTEDYQSLNGKYGRYFAGRFMEAPAMFKRKNKYYLMMSGCTGWSPNEARSAVSDSVLGNWKELGNPCVGDLSKRTFNSQSTCIFPVYGKKDAFIYMGDRWTPNDPVDGRYVWLPVRFEDNRFVIEWKEKWLIKDIN